MLRLTFLSLLLGVIGCAPVTQLELRGNPKGNAVYNFRQMTYRDRPDGGIEILGYGLIPFRNDPLDRDYNPRWPESGFITFWLYAAPGTGDEYVLTMLGPSKLLGPGDDEVLMATLQNAQVESSGPARVIKLVDVSTTSRNHPELVLKLSGNLIARPGDPAEFERQSKQYQYELTSR